MNQTFNQMNQTFNQMNQTFNQIFNQINQSIMQKHKFKYLPKELFLGIISYCTFEDIKNFIFTSIDLWYELKLLLIENFDYRQGDNKKKKK